MLIYAKNIYNFEFHMNREYAFNRDKGKCRCCGKYLLYTDDKGCHHINNHLPMNKINKVANLAWVCNECHRQIHSSAEINTSDSKTKKKIEKFRTKLSEI